MTGRIKRSDLLLMNEAKIKQSNILSQKYINDFNDLKKILTMQMNTLLTGFESMQLIYKSNVELRSSHNTEIIAQLTSRIKTQDVKISKMETEFKNLNSNPIPSDITKKTDKIIQNVKVTTKPQTPKICIPVPVNPEFSNVTLNNANAYLKAVKVQRN